MNKKLPENIRALIHDELEAMEKEGFLIVGADLIACNRVISKVLEKSDLLLGLKIASHDLRKLQTIDGDFADKAATSAEEIINLYDPAYKPYTLNIKPHPKVDVDGIMTSLYRKFKEWSERGFGPDDVTWCEVRAEIESLLKQPKEQS